MSLGEKLQGVHNKVNTKLGTQDATITIRQVTVTESDDLGMPYGSVTNSDIVITSGCKVGFAKSYEENESGTIKFGDLKLLIPGGLVTESQLENANVLYKGKTYSVKTTYPKEIYSGVPVNWVVFARVEV